MDNHIQGKSGVADGLVFKIIYLVGLVVSACALFMPAKEDDIIAKQTVSNLFQAITGKNSDGTPYVNMLFGHGSENLIGIPDILLEILICFLPAAVLVATAIIMFLASHRITGMILGLVGTVIILGRDICLLFTDSGFFGVYMNITGAVITILGLLLFYINQNEEYVVAGLITCRTGTFAGNTFEVVDQVVIGKNPNECNIVLNNKTISRVHCIVKYLVESDSYTVKDVSSNGTFLGDGRRFAKNYEAHVERGTEIYMGDPRETFYLD